MNVSVDPALVTTIGGLIALWLNQFFAARKNAEDRRAKADELKAYLSLVSNNNAKAIEGKISDSRDDLQRELTINTQISKDAFHEANNANMKIAAALKIESTSSEQANRIEAIGVDTNKMVRDKQ